MELNRIALSSRGRRTTGGARGRATATLAYVPHVV